MTELKIEQTSRTWKIVLDGFDLTNAVRSFKIEADAMTRRAIVELDLGVDEIEITCLGEGEDTIMVSVPNEDALQAIGWTKIGNRNAYTRPREEPEL